MTDRLAALRVNAEWNRFLYRSVLLEWETSVRHRTAFPRFNGKKPLCGVTLVKMGTLQDVNAAFAAHASLPKTAERLVFHSSEQALKNLFALLRNCVAHAHFSSPRRGWIAFHHQHQGKTRLFGQLRFASLKALMAELLEESSTQVAVASKRDGAK